MPEKVKTAKSKLKSLAEVCSLINSSLDIQTVLTNAMGCVQSVMDAEASSIFELDRGCGELHFRIALGNAADKLKGAIIRIGDGIAGRVAQTGEAIIVSDAQEDSRVYRDVDSSTGFKTRSILCAPMKSRGRIIGVLEVLNKRGSGHFTRRDLEMLSILADLIAVALENARLYTRLSEKFAVTEQELNATQARLIRSERLAALGKLSEGVAHEVRNPVMVIGGFARRLHKQFADVEPVRKSAEVILTEAERLERMVSDIEGFCRLPPPTPRTISALGIVERIAGETAEACRSQNIQVTTTVKGTVRDFDADGEMLGIALRNIVTNSIDAMPEGGRLELGLDFQPDSVVICVKDNGPGIPAADLPNVFDPFFTSKTRGSGLGLTVAHRIVSDHGGEIVINSEANRGAEVKMIIPGERRTDS